MKEVHHVLIKKRKLEIIAIIFSVIVMIGLLITVIILAIQLHNSRKKSNDCDNCKVCSTDGNLTQCCFKGQGQPFIDSHLQQQGCK